MRSLFWFVLIKLRHCGHLALSGSLKLRAKLVLYLVDFKALRAKALSSTVQCCPAWQLVWCVIVTGCDCQLDFNEDYYLVLHDVIAICRAP